eukprot:8708011-Alexandrium_andersonii.AAC.1
MSASLVGSEMCIRDRLDVHVRRVELDLNGLRELAPIAGSTRLADGARDAVSYTHLTLPTICSV